MKRSRVSLRTVQVFAVASLLSLALTTFGCRPGSRSVQNAPPPRASDADQGASDSGPAATSRQERGESLDSDLQNPIDGPILPPVLVDVDAPSDASEPDATDQRRDASDADDSRDADQPEDYTSWSEPALTLVVTGQQNGYLEPCGCTGLDRQKGGVARRFTLLRQLRERGWELLPIDAGNQIRRHGPQAEIKYHRTLEALRAMEYGAVGFGPDDLRLSVGDLIQEAAADLDDEAVYLSANVVLFDPTLMPRFKTIEAGGMKVAVTSLLDPAALTAEAGGEIEVGSPGEAAQSVMQEIQESAPDFSVLMYFGDEAAAEELVRDVPGFDLLVVAGGDGEPLYRPHSISESSTQMIITGNKGMHAGLVGLDPDGTIQYARVPLTHEFEDAPEMRRLMADYQQQLKEVGLEGLGLRPNRHPTGERFVGSQTCGECHTEAFDVWEWTPHALATEHIVEPPSDRGDVARHFDPECLSCHVTGWHPQNYLPYESGYLSLDTDSHLTGNGCENCHGPGESHVAAEQGNLDVSDDRRKELRLAMQLPLERAREKCLECHDIDNSPDFHDPDAFEDVYWPQVEHYGLD